VGVDGASRDPNLFGLPLMVFDLGAAALKSLFGHSRPHLFPS